MRQSTFWNAAGEIVVECRLQACQSIEPLRASMLKRVYDYILDRGQFGATDEQIAHALRLRESTCRARRVELRDASRIIDSGRTRPTRSGRKATVWISADQPLN